MRAHALAQLLLDGPDLEVDVDVDMDRKDEGRVFAHVVFVRAEARKIVIDAEMWAVTFDDGP